MTVRQQTRLFGDSKSGSSLERYQFTNPGYVADYEDVETALRNRAERLAQMAHSLVVSARLAYENENSGVAMDQRGIGGTLEVAEAVNFDLLQQVEMDGMSQEHSRAEAAV